jgi:Ankyrin repeats (3 copies)
LQKNVAFVKQWLSQNAAYKPDLQYFFEERFAYTGWTGDVEMLEITDRKDVVKVLGQGQNSMLILAFMNLHLEFAESVMAIDGATEGGNGTQLPFNREDWIALFTAVNGDPDMVKLLAWAAGSFRFVTGDSPPILLSVACPANLDTIRTLVRLGWGIRGVSDKYGLTAMHYAATVPNVETLKFLKKVGLNINAEAHGGRRPVYDAACFGHVENIRWFKQAGARITDPQDSYYGQKLMHAAAENGRLLVIEYLQEIGESLSVRDSWQHTPLHFAA